MINEWAYFEVQRCIFQECSSSSIARSSPPWFCPPSTSGITSSTGISCSRSPSLSLPDDGLLLCLISASSTHLRVSAAIVSFLFLIFPLFIWVLSVFWLQIQIRPFQPLWLLTIFSLSQVVVQVEPGQVLQLSCI